MRDKYLTKKKKIEAEVYGDEFEAIDEEEQAKLEKKERRHLKKKKIEAEVYGDEFDADDEED